MSDDLSKVASLSECELALRTIGELERDQKRDKARISERMAKLQAALDQANTLIVNGQETTRANRIAELRKMVDEFANNNRDMLVAGNGGGKTAVLANGTISWRRGQPSVAFQEDEAASREKLRRLKGVSRLVDTLLSTVGLSFVSIEFNISRSAALALWKAGQLTRGQLNKAGLEFREPIEICKIEAAEHARESTAEGETAA